MYVCIAFIVNEPRHHKEEAVTIPLDLSTKLKDHQVGEYYAYYYITPYLSMSH